MYQLIKELPGHPVGITFDTYIGQFFGRDLVQSGFAKELSAAKTVADLKPGDKVFHLYSDGTITDGFFSRRFFKNIINQGNMFLNFSEAHMEMQRRAIRAKVFKPSKGDKFYYIFDDGNCIADIWIGSQDQFAKLAMCNVWRTRDEAIDYSNSLWLFTHQG